MALWTLEHDDPTDWINRSIWMLLSAVVSSMILKARSRSITKGIPAAIAVSLAIAVFFIKGDMETRSDAHYERFFLLSIFLFKIPLSLLICAIVYGVLRWVGYERPIYSFRARSPKKK